ncbi:hypothetical protein APHAL10511_003050 [Amanita phalloides]|nr:hypothetical protein APHAL10511_003050 [Amanita phalloides]
MYTWLSPLAELRLAVAFALAPTIRAILSNPRLLFHPSLLSTLFFTHVWAAFADGVDSNSRDTKRLLITPHASGHVLDIGAGYGHTLQYLDHPKIVRYIALEPNSLMHPRIRSAANAAGYSEDNGSLLILSCGAEDTDHILSATGSQLDTLISVLTLCTVPAPQQTIAAMTDRLLKPGGQLLFYEHVLNPQPDIAWWQRFWTPIWALAFDGCRLDRPTDVWIEQTDGWARGQAWDKTGEPADHLFRHRYGRYEKAGVSD